MSAGEYSDAVQDYLRVIYKLEKRDGRATTSAIAKALGVTAASATGMVTKLAERDLVVHEPYRGVKLTPAAARAALEMVRHHRLLESYLAESLEVPLPDVHEEADRLEHGLSENLEAHIDASLGHPTHDPHGDPIPDSDLNVASDQFRALLTLGVGETATIERVPDGDASLLDYLCDLGITPGTRVEVRSVTPGGEPVTLMVDGVERAISRELAADIRVS